MNCILHFVYKIDKSISCNTNILPNRLDVFKGPADASNMHHSAPLVPVS